MAPVDRAYLDVDGSQVYCDSIDIDPENDLDFVTAMTQDNNPLGVQSGNQRFTVSADATMLESEDVDFVDLWQNQTNVPVKVIYEGGVTWSFSNGVISKPGIGARHGEKVTHSIEMKCWGLAVS